MRVAIFNREKRFTASRAEGMDDLTRKGGQLVDDLRAAVANLNGTITRLNTRAAQNRDV